MPAWNHGAVLSSPSSGLLVRLSNLSGGGGGGGGGVRPSLGAEPLTELLELLSPEILFTFRSVSVLLGELCDNLHNQPSKIKKN